MLFSLLRNPFCTHTRNGVKLRACNSFNSFTQPAPAFVITNFIRVTRRSHASSSSSRWKSRQHKDQYVINARVQDLKSRAAFKLLEIHERHKIFQKGNTVVDLGYAPGSWSQVAVDRTSPHGRVIGIDIIPAQPPKGVSTIQGNFLSRAVQDEVKKFVRESHRGRLRHQPSLSSATDDERLTAEDLMRSSFSILELENRADLHHSTDNSEDTQTERCKRDVTDWTLGRTVDVVLSDMSEPWEQTDGFWKRSLSDPYYRMMNTSGINTRDHAGSMDLCYAALQFTSDTLRTGGHFVCKFYQGAEDKALELRLKSLFTKVHREKPESSRKESKEAYFVALRRKGDADLNNVF